MDWFKLVYYQVIRFCNRDIYDAGCQGGDQTGNFLIAVHLFLLERLYVIEECGAK